MRRTLAFTFVTLFSLLGIAALAQQGPPPIGTPGGSTYTGTSPIVVSGTAISCPTCGTSTGTVTSVGFTGGLVSVGTPTSTPAFTVAGTSGGVPYFSSASTWASSAAGTVNTLMKWGGAGNPPVASSITDNATTISSSELVNFSGTGAASTSPFLLNGTPFTGGNSTTNFPYLYMNFGTAPTTFSANGVLLGVNAPSGFGGNAIEYHLNGGSTLFNVTSGGAISTSTTVSAGSTVSGSKYLTGTNCSASGTAANPSVVTCSSASSGAFACSPSATGGTCQVNTSAAATNSDIEITPTASAGTRLGVTCNTTADVPTGPRIASISNGASFTINLGTVSTNPTCYFYTITN